MDHKGGFSVNEIENKLKQEISNAVKQAWDIDMMASDVVIEIPKDKSHGDYATNLAMRLTKQLKQNPRMIAETLIQNLDLAKAGIQEATIAGPGFINFIMETESLGSVINTVLKSQEHYGDSNDGNGLKVDLEYVSVNPTGDIHVAHGRGAAIGDAVSRLMKKAGYEVTREYYVNDGGNQIHNLGLSLYARYQQLFGKEVEMPEDGYYAHDIVDIANDLKNEFGDQFLNCTSDEAIEFFKKEGCKRELEKIKRDLNLFRVEFDVWFSERSLYEQHKVEEILQVLKDKDMVYEKEDALWLKTSLYGDDKDRVLVKTDGTYTYVTPDIAYHNNKFERGYDMLVDILGADHHGYINRMKAAMQTLGYNKDALNIDIIQMVRLIKDGEEVKMSKRTGNAIALRELIEEIGVDATRYNFVSRAADTHLDFDLGLAVAQTNDNPVYYAQYAHARMCSILRNAPEIQLQEQYSLLSHEKETALLKQINEFPAVVADAARNRAPHKVCNYIQKIAQAFHSFYAGCKVLDDSNLPLQQERLALVKATQITLKNALEVIGVTAPEKM
ncbi:MAG: arginine--tRNA ligase [Erysipelotrichaceae bacterium]|nr:arginine--tRNA ligase [Erysipelotrichaceae bacterium]